MNAIEVLKKYWGFTQFRPLQEDIIQSVSEGKDTLALLPTGGGKSICFQVPALAADGICIVVSPLIALMKDQVEALKKKGIRAQQLVSGMSRQEVDIALDNCIFGNYKFLYLSPERLTNEMVRLRIEKMNVNLIAVDEAHCISQWGYDFRPSYLRIAELRELHPKVPVLALTATATPKVTEDIQQKLLFRKENVFRKSFERKNLSYLVLYDEDKITKAVEILHKIHGSSLVYARNRKHTRELAETFQQYGISADYYHAGLDHASRSRKQLDWLHGKIRVIVATNAFGMGIDKPDVRTVIHMDVPDSPEAYFQEAGRAGRDEKPAYAVLFYAEHDRMEIEKRFQQSFPDLQFIRQVYHAVGNYLQVPIGSGEGSSYDFEVATFSRNYNLSTLEVYNSIRILELDGYLQLSESANLPSRLHIRVDPMELYKFQVASPVLDPFIKTILRSYEGLFDDFVIIHEQEIASRGSMEVEKVIKNLQYLERCGIVDYKPQAEKPQLVFTRERMAADKLHISKESLAERKKRFRDRAGAMLSYASSTHKCRSQMLLRYFGEKKDLRCGTCDYCRERNKLSLNDMEFEQLTGRIKEELLKQPSTLQEIIEKLRIANNDKALHTLQWLLDNDLVKFNNSNRLQWHED